jgi:UDP-glucose 4-epimerase
MGCGSEAEFEGETVLITGAAGAVGRELSDRLMGLPRCTVVRVGRNAGPLVDHTCSLQDGGQISDLLRQFSPSHVFHCAGSFSNLWADDFQNNVNVTCSLLTALEKVSNSVRVMLFGSAAEYGNSYIGPVAESVAPRPISPYGVTKSMQTSLMGYFSRMRGVDIVCSRLFNLYGRGISPLLFPGRITEQIEGLRSGKIEKGSIRSLAGSRDYISVPEAVDATLAIMRHGIGGEVYNVGRGRPMSNFDLFHELLRNSGVSPDRIEVGEPSLDPGTCGWADLTKFKKMMLQ